MMSQTASSRHPLTASSPPKSPLARYRVLSPTASLRVSPLCLGGMNFGDAWKGYMGACDKKTTEGILDFFYEQGGNFIDTSNNYQAQESERWIGEWMQKRGNRDQMVIATKYTTCFQPVDSGINVNFTGNGTKSMHVSVNASLKKLQTDYIDLVCACLLCIPLLIEPDMLMRSCATSSMSTGGTSAPRFPR